MNWTVLSTKSRSADGVFVPGRDDLDHRDDAAEVVSTTMRLARRRRSPCPNDDDLRDGRFQGGHAGNLHVEPTSLEPGLQWRERRARGDRTVVPRGRRSPWAAGRHLAHLIRTHHLYENRDIDPMAHGSSRAVAWAASPTLAGAGLREGRFFRPSSILDSTRRPCRRGVSFCSPLPPPASLVTDLYSVPCGP